MTLKTQAMPVRCVTQAPMHHFFGYYDKCPWSREGQYLLAMQNAFMDRDPRPDDRLTVGYIDLDNNDRFIPIGQTRAWNWQQGCMLRWMTPGEQEKIVYNDREADRFVSRVYDVASGQTQTLDNSLYDIASNGHTGATLSFERVHHTRPGYGYAGLPDTRGDVLQPDDDGLYRVDLKTGERELVFSIAEAAKYGSVKPQLDDKAWFNHITFNPSGSRLIFLHRFAQGSHPGIRGFTTRLFTINPDGTDPICLLEGCGISHFDWFGDDQIALWTWDQNYNEAEVGQFVLLSARDAQQRSVIGQDVLNCDGHCNFSPDRKWMLTDTYPQGQSREQVLMMYDMQAQTRRNLGAFYSMPADEPSMRCDMHPRWNRVGTQVCIDSTHEGTRQMYIIDVQSKA